MMIRTAKLLVLGVILSLLGCGSIHYTRGLEYNIKGQSEKAIEEYKKGLSTNDYRLLFSLYTNIGVSYQLLDKKEKAKEYYLKAAAQWPARAYYPYGNLADLAHKQGRLLEAVKYSQKATFLVQSDEYEKVEKGTGFGINTLKKRVIARNDYLQLVLNFSDLKKHFERKRYQEVRRLADEIINKKYRVDLGIITVGDIVHEVVQGGIADLNGIIKNDEILEIDGTKIITGTLITDAASLVNAIANISEKFNEKVSIKIKRKNRKITIACYLYYPELETTKRMLKEAEKVLATGKGKFFPKDLEPPQLLILQPETKLDAQIVAKKSIEFVVLAGDNFQVKEVSVNGATFNPSEASTLEKSLLVGQVKKYTANIPLIEGVTTYNVTAIDTSGNLATKKIALSHNPRLDMQPETIYDHSIAVVIGINKYHTWPSLEFAVSDAKAIKEKLYGLGFHQVIELYDSEASRLQILSLLGDKLPNLLGKNDSLMIYFAGHGQTETFENRDKQGQIIIEKEGYIIPIDADTKNYEGTAISMSKIRDMATKYKAKHILFVFDSCYSGLGLKRSGGMKKADNYIKKLSQMKAVQIITAGGENEEVGEEKGHGIFTRHFLLALEGNADLDNDGFITASEVGTYIRPTVSRKTNNTQTPRFGWILGEGDFIFENPS